MRDNLSYEDVDAELYQKLRDSSASPFYKKTYADIFLFAIALAVDKDLEPIPLKKKAPNIPVSAFQRNIWVINAIAIDKQGSFKALFDDENIFDLAEEYANRGIKSLYKEVFEEPGDIYRRFESLARSIK